LIQLFNGNLQLKKAQANFIKFVETYNNLYSTNIKVKPLGSLSRVSLENKWLAGFWEAEGGFSASIRIDIRKNKSYKRLVLKAYLDQKNEKNLIVHIQTLLKGALVNRANNCYRVDISSKEGLSRVERYFTNSFIGKKRLVDDIWLQVFDSKYNENSQTFNTITKQEELVEWLQDQNAQFQQMKSVLLLSDQ
jgi:hypothetical protein